MFVAWGLQRNQEARIIELEADSAADQVDTVLASHLLPSDFDQPLSPERFRQIDQLIRRDIELSALYDLSRSLVNAPPEEGKSLDIIVSHAVDTLHVTFACIFLLEEESVVQRAAFPVRFLGRDLNVEQCHLGTFCPSPMNAALASEPVLLGKDETAAFSEREQRMLYLDLAQTICLIPIKAGEIPLGIMLLGEARGERREPFSQEKLRLCGSIADQAASALQRASLFSDLEKAYLETVLTLANAVEAKDTYTKNHAQNVSSMAVEVGKAMELDDSQLEDLKYGGILHDVGKIGVPDAILKKPGRLDDEEWIIMRSHAALGAEIIKPVRRLAGAAQVVRHHHERYDGNGYPDEIAGDAIPITARILTTIDSYSAIVDRRPYKQARGHDEALEELRHCAGSQFDPLIVDTFIKLFENGVLTPES